MMMGSKEVNKCSKKHGLPPGLIEKIFMNKNEDCRTFVNAGEEKDFLSLKERLQTKRVT